MGQRIVWIHGLGNETAGYSIPWTAVFNEYLGLPPESFVEVLWADLVAGSEATSRLVVAGGALARPISKAARAKQQQADRIRAELQMRLQAHTAALSHLEASRTNHPLTARLDLGSIPIIGGLLGAAGGASAYIEEFIGYFVDAQLRASIQQRLRDAILPLAAAGHDITIIAHSWGTVIARDTLLALVTQAPSVRVQCLFTLGCPLWLVRSYLQDPNAPALANTGVWANVFARGDVIASWLAPDLMPDREYGVPSLGTDAHGSYLVHGNAEVQRDIVAEYVLRQVAAPVPVR